jgi:N-acetylmuramoyl-L-alanine amidase
MKRILTIAFIFGFFASAQINYEALLRAGFTELQTRYPGSGGGAYGNAQEIAQALGLGFVEAGGRVSLSIGSKVASFRISRDSEEAGRNKWAWANRGYWIPVRQLAANLDLRYVLEYGLSPTIALKPAKLLEVRSGKVGKVQRYTLVFDRDVQVQLVSSNPPELALIGVKDKADLGSPDLLAESTAYGYKLSLPATEGTPRLFFQPRQAVVEWGEVKRRPKVVLDAGHGGDDAGTAVEKLREKDLTLSLASRVEKLLAASPVEVVLSRRVDKNFPLEARAQLLSTGQVALSLHAVPGDAVGLYSYPESSGLTFLSKGRQLLPKTPEPQKTTLGRYIAPAGSSTRLTQLVSEALATSGLVASQSQGPYFVLGQVGGAGAMLEFGFEHLRTPQDRDAIARAVANGILNYLGLPTLTPPPTTDPTQTPPPGQTAPGQKPPGGN